MKNPAGFLLIAVFVTAIAGALAFFALSGSGIATGSESAMWWLPDLVTFLAVEAVALALSVLVLVTLIKRFQESLLRYIDSKWLPSTKPVDEDSKFERQWYRTELGERHEMTRAETWWTGTFTKTLKPFFASMTAAIVLSAVVNALLPVPLIISVILVFVVTLFCLVMGTVPAYIRSEWLRRNTFVIVFTHNVFYMRAHSGGLTGLLTGKSEDVTRDVTPMSLVKELKLATDPRRLTDPDKEHNDLKNTFYDLLGSSKRRRLDPFRFLARGVRTVFLPSFFKGASNTFLSLESGEAFVGVLEALGRRSQEIKDYLREVNSAAAKWIIGDPKDANWSVEAARVSTEEFKAQRTAHYVQPHAVNLWSLREDPGVWDLETGEELVAFNPYVSSGGASYHQVVVPAAVLGAIELGSPDMAGYQSTTSVRPDPDSEDFIPPLGE